MEENKYFVTYNLTSHPDGIAREQVPEGDGAATAVAILSMIYPPDGSFSLLVASLDGRTGETVSDKELWKVWTLMAKELSNSATLSPNKKELCALTFDIMRQGILSAMGESKAAHEHT